MKRMISIAAVLAATALVGACDSARVKDEQGRKLTLVAPASQSLKQGDTNKVMVAIARKGFEDNVAIRFEGLPPGVRVVEAEPTIPRDDNTATFTLEASGNAALVEDQAATVTASAPGGMSVSETFKVSVKPAK